MLKVLASCLAVLTAALSPSALAAPIAMDASPSTRLDADLRCHLGVYALPDGRSLTITGSGGEKRALSYAFSDGRFGALSESGGGGFSADRLSLTFSACEVGAVQLTQGALTETGKKLHLVQREVRFTSEGVSLFGKLVLPEGGTASAIAVWIEGSNNNPSTDDAMWQYELAQRGVGVFVYDKRGTGASSGAQSSDFTVRARDTAAAIAEVRRLAPEVRHVGVIGASQGGWVAPLTALETSVDFVITAFGMAQSPIAQDQALVENQIRKAGFGETELSQARLLTTITEQIVRTNLVDGPDLEQAFARLDAFKAEFGRAPWVAAIQPRSYTGLFLQFSSADIKIHGPALAQGLTFDFEPRPVIQRLASRQLWLLGGSDTQAPSGATQSVLRELQDEGRDIAVVVFPNADHGLIETRKRANTAEAVLSPGQFDIAAQWIKRNSLPGAGRFVILQGDAF